MNGHSHLINNLISVENFFAKSLQSFEKACEVLKNESRFYFFLAEKQLLIRSAGTNLQNTTCQALKHIENFPTSIDASSIFEIFTWDEKESGIPMPTTPWESPINLAEDSLMQFHLEHFFVSQFDNKTILFIINNASNQAICIIKDAAKLNNAFLSSPFFKIIAVWASKFHLNILHAGCISFKDKGVLIVGRSGKGKSSTSVQCIIDGLNYLSDDYILVDLNGEKPMAYSIFNSGKLKNKHIERFSKIDGKYRQGILDKNDKPLLFLYPFFKDQIIRSTEIRAIIVPNITNEELASYHTISEIESLRALAPSTLIQLKINNLNSLNTLANLTRSLPNYALNIGSNFTHISSKVKELIEAL